MTMPVEVCRAATHLGAYEPTERVVEEEQQTEQPAELSDELKKLQTDIEKHAAQLLEATQAEYNSFCHLSSQLDGCSPNHSLHSPCPPRSGVHLNCALPQAHPRREDQAGDKQGQGLAAEDALPVLLRRN